MLAQDVVRSYGERARFAVQDLGASPLADRFGVDKYPAIFVDDALVSRPEDFYAWGGPPTGKYIPWSEPANRRRFQDDLRRMIDLRLAGGKVPSATARKKAPAVRLLPDVELTDLQGRHFRLKDLRGKPLLVEFWATWCPPCLQSMAHLKKLDSSAMHVVLIAIESKRADVDAILERVHPPGRVVIGTQPIRDAFDGPPAVPTMVLADREGRIARVFYGAPANMDEEITREVARLR